MNKKRNLQKELNVKGCAKTTSNALDINIDKIKCMVNNQIVSASVPYSLLSIHRKRQFLEKSEERRVKR